MCFVGISATLAGMPTGKNEKHGGAGVLCFTVSCEMEHCEPFTAGGRCGILHGGPPGRRPGSPGVVPGAASETVHVTGIGPGRETARA